MPFILVLGIFLVHFSSLHFVAALFLLFTLLSYWSFFLLSPLLYPLLSLSLSLPFPVHATRNKGNFMKNAQQPHCIPHKRPNTHTHNSQAQRNVRLLKPHRRNNKSSHIKYTLNECNGRVWMILVLFLSIRMSFQCLHLSIYNSSKDEGRVAAMGDSSESPTCHVL